MSAREIILRELRRSLGRSGPLTPAVAAPLDGRLERPAPNLKPALAGDLAERFGEKLETAGASVERIAGADEIGAAIGRYLEAHGLDTRLVAAADPLLERLRWPRGLVVETRASAGRDAAGLSVAFTAVAESGTLVLVSGPGRPTTVNFLVEHHLVLVPAERLVPHLEDAWARLRTARWPLPRTINLISGPSKTADVEQTIQLGAHGPKALHVMVIGGS